MTADEGFAVAKMLLKEHFGNDFIITTAYMEKVNVWPSVKFEDTKALKAYGLFLCECSNAMDEPVMGVKLDPRTAQTETSLGTVYCPNRVVKSTAGTQE